jgi:transcriptional regulator with XRE-family HTH domain
MAPMDIAVHAGIVGGLPLAVAAGSVRSAVTVAIEFGNAGNGWAGALVFNVWLRRQLRERRMTQRMLASISGVDHSTISRLLRSRREPSLATATKLAQALRKLDGPLEVADYFVRLPEEAILPTRRVEMALRGDDDLDDADIRALMDAYLVARARRRRTRHASTVRADGRSRAHRS